MLSDAELLIRSRTDPAAFGDLYARHADAVYRYLARRVGPDIAQDLHSEVFLRALEARHRSRPHASGSMLPWLYGIARNLLLKQRPARPLPLINDAPDGSDWTAVDHRIDADAVGERLTLALAGLSPGEREVLLLVSWEELPIADIAELLGIRPGAVRTRLHRARAHAAAALAAAPHPYQPQEN